MPTTPRLPRTDSGTGFMGGEGGDPFKGVTTGFLGARAASASCSPHRRKEKETGPQGPVFANKGLSREPRWVPKVRSTLARVGSSRHTVPSRSALVAPTAPMLPTTQEFYITSTDTT